MKENFPKEWENEFREFLETQRVEPPRKVSEEIHSTVFRQLNPPPWSVFLKLLGITAVTGIFSLGICPQFGFGNNFWLMRFFMKFGPHVCSSACGAIFISLGVILSFYFLRPEELRVLRRTRFLQFTVLSMLTLSGFVCAGGEVFATLALFWALGAVVGGILTLEISYRIKFAELRTV